MNRAGAVILLVLVSARLALAGGAPEVKSSLPSHSLEQLDSAANLLMRAADGGPSCPGLSSEEAKTLLLPLRALIDRKSEVRLRARRKGRVSSPGWSKNCARDCHCGLYVSLLEKAGESRLTAEDRAVLKNVSAQAERLSGAGLDACVARFAPGFCQGSLLRYLRQEAPAFKAE